MISPPSPHTSRYESPQSFNLSTTSSTSSELSKLDEFRFFVNPKRWLGIIQALVEQMPASHLIFLHNILTTLLLNAAVPLLLLQLSLWYLPSTILPLTNTEFNSSFETHLMPQKQRSNSPIFLQTNSLSHKPLHHVLNLMTLALTLPINTTYSHSHTHPPSMKKLLLPILCSPYTLATCSKKIASQISIFINRYRMWKILRIEPDEEAMVCLERGMSRNEIIRTKMFDVYFPPISRHNDNPGDTIQQQNEKNQKGIIILPGAFVNHASYSNIAKKISEKGIIAVVLSMEPLRLACKGMGADFSDIRNAMSLVQKGWIKRTTGSGKINCNCGSIEWSIGGHSLGAYSAMKLSTKLKNYLVNQKKCQKTLKVVIWAAGDTLRYVPDLSKHQHQLEALVILGSNDAYCDFSSTNKKRVLLPSFLSKLPRNRTCTFIEGGTHNNFASYSGPVEYNGIPGISKNRQHNLVVNETTNFLLNNGNY